MNLIHIFEIFQKAIADYHIKDKLDTPCPNPFQDSSIEHLLYFKCWIDTVQWHCEDEVRNPAIEAEKVRFFKNKIDELNQTRTNLVERLDDYFLNIYKDVQVLDQARLNTESPAWAIDRLSILALKIYHMQLEVERTDLTTEQFHAYQQKLELLQTQKLDLIQAISVLLEEIEQGRTQFKVYRQVKMYNDSDLNPILRASKL
ncbi:MAG: DUF4254 domain-containing protein [Chitinophagales bacterium]|nr:DUF4254 domain-containing protein [Chitinophagales bacterium]